MAGTASQATGRWRDNQPVVNFPDNLRGACGGDALLAADPLPASGRKPFRIGLIGFGHIVQSCHVPAIRILQKHGIVIDVVAIADPSEKARRMAADLFPGAKPFENALPLMDETQLDGVLIAVYPPLAASLTREALARDLPILVEKPILHEAPGLRELARSDRRSERVLVGYNRRWQPLANLMKKEIAKGGLLSVRAAFHRCARRERFFYRDTMGHPLDFLASVCGPLNLKTVCWSNTPDGQDIPAGVSVQFGTVSSIPIQLDMRPDAGRVVEDYELTFPGLTLRLAYLPVTGTQCQNACLEIHENGSSVRIGEVSAFDPMEDQILSRGFVHQLAAFTVEASGGDPAARPARLEDAARAMELCSAIMKSCPADLPGSPLE